MLGACGGGGGTSSAPEPEITPPSHLTYPTAPEFVVNTAITPLNPTVTGQVTSYSVSPALPAGLSLNTSTGVISGIPTTATAKADYTIQATNAGGSTTAILSIGVMAAATSPPYDLQYPTPPTFVVNTAITPLNPTVVGQVTSYSVSPALPTGLSLDTSTGVISGTPTAAMIATLYTIKASNAAGFTTVTISIAVMTPPPPPSASIGYGSIFGLTANLPAQTISPFVSNATVVSWAISPALPTGLNFDTSKGTISGTPTVAAALSNYAVIGTYSGGQLKTTLTLAVAAAPVLRVKHISAIETIRYSNSSLISLDIGGHWELQAYGSGASLASGDGACGGGDCVVVSSIHPPVDVESNTAIDVAAGGIEVRSAVSGQLIATIPGKFSWVELASDASYIATGSATALTIWNAAGKTTLTFAGDYSDSIAFSAPGQIQIAAAPTGQNVVQTILLPSGSSTLSSAYQGTFGAWFRDGKGFLTSSGETIWIYSSAVVQQNFTSVTSVGTLGGEGNFFWNLHGGTLDIYQVDGAASPVLTTGASSIFASGTTLGAFASASQQLAVIDLSGAAPSSASFTLPTAMDSATAYAAISASSWVVGNNFGVIVDGASLGSDPRYFAFGRPSITAGTTYFSVATASGQIFYFDAKTDAMLGTAQFQGGSGEVPEALSSSSDGSVLAVVGNANVNVFSLPSGALSSSLSIGQVKAPVEQLSLSGTGTVLGISGCGVMTVPVTGSSCQPPVGDTVLISPDGSQWAISNVPSITVQNTVSAATAIYANGTLATTVNGWVVGWLDNTRLLVEQFIARPPPASEIGGNEFTLQYSGTTIFGSSGSNLGTVLPDLGFQSLQVLSGDSIYTIQTNTIISLEDESTLWMSKNSASHVYTGAASGSQVIFPSGSLILAQPY